MHIIKYYFLLVGLLLGNALLAQVTLVHVNKSTIDRNKVAYSGTRIMTVDAVETMQGNRLYIFSKNEKGETADSLYAEEFMKEDNVWQIQCKRGFSFPNSILMTWGNRKAFFDADKDHTPESLFIFSKNDASNLDKQQSVFLLLFHQRQFYTIESKAEDQYIQNYYSDNFDKLPAVIKDRILDYWKKLDKTN
ncbi:hypothetical protein [Sphingobacterium sp. SYP-B4668]|uniref:hypothetical protein n=1 Tax=Sphingobacterium sp. SYP-B4668 TaxID=2996035 RepID=UPI0022DD802A|nr:hypothetical protein [Sphingobacterium sp. SYP-B4668]